MRSRSEVVQHDAYRRSELVDSARMEPPSMASGDTRTGDEVGEHAANVVGERAAAVIRGEEDGGGNVHGARAVGIAGACEGSHLQCHAGFDGLTSEAPLPEPPACA